MARRKKYNKAQKRQRRQQKEIEQRKDVATDTAAIFTCSTEVVSDFARQCERIREDVECDLLYNRIAHEIWDKRPGAAADIADALADFAAERQRHLESIDKLSARFAALARDDSFHEHLDPVEQYRELVEMRLSEIGETNTRDLPF